MHDSDPTREQLLAELASLRQRVITRETAETHHVSAATERKRANGQASLESAALRAAANAIVITDRAGLIQWVNPAFSEMTGYTAGEAIGKNPRDLVKSGEHTPEFFQSLWETVLAGQVWRGDMVNRRKDGSLYFEDQTITPVRDAQGTISRATCSRSAANRSSNPRGWTSTR